MNKDKYKENDLLNNYIKFNLKNLKFSEVKLYINNNYIVRIGFENYYIYKEIVDVNYQQITDIKKIDLENYYVEDYYHFNYGNDGIIIKLYTNLYLKNNKILPLKVETVKKEIEPVKIEDEKIIEKSSILIENEKSTILNDDELDVLNWLNN